MSQNTDPGGREREIRRAGNQPPDTPAESTLEDLLPRLLEGVDDVSTGYLVRAILPPESPNRAGEQLVDALERKVTVVGSTLDAGVDPVDPQVDVLIQCEYTASQVASALGGVTPVQGAVVVDVTDVCERVLEPPEETEEADAADANDVFSELQQQVNELDYDQVVDELEDVSFPGGPDPEEEVDLEDEADVDLGTDGQDDDTSLGDVSLDDGALDAVGSDGESSDGAGASGGSTGNGTGGDLDLGSEDVDAKELFGEDGSDDGKESGVVGGADEQRIEEAVRSIEQETGDADDAEPDEQAPEADAGGVELDVDDGAGDVAGSDASHAGDVDDLVEDLIAALESGAVGPERRQRLREALGVESTHSLDVRLEYLQKRVDNLAAYTDAWEAFLAEEGTGNEFIENVENIERRLDELEDRQEDVEETVGSLRSTIDALNSWRDRVNDVLGDRL